MLVVGLVLTRLLGLHVHACADPGLGHSHSAPHYAGLLFGEAHPGDDPDDREISLPDGLLAKLASSHGDALGLPTSENPVPDTRRRACRQSAPRGPPLAFTADVHALRPPLRGPPIDSLS